MSDIAGYMTGIHRECDELFVQAEQAIANGQWVEAGKQLAAFVQDLEHHLQQEENVLFPRFEQATGMTQGPTEMMRMEHSQMRALCQELEQAVTNENKLQGLGVCETLMILMQQHNMKEEQVLYPMTDRTLADSDAVVSELRAY